MVQVTIRDFYLQADTLGLHLTLTLWVQCIFAFAVNFLIFTKQTFMHLCCLICFSALWKGCIYRKFCYISSLNLMWIKSDDRKTANDMFLGITNISATIFMCFKRIENSYIRPTLCPGLHITTSEQTRHLGVIGIIDHKNTIAIFHALVKILGDFLKIRTITLHVHRYGQCICSVKFLDTVLQSLSVVYVCWYNNLARQFTCVTVMTVSSDL